MSAARPMTPEDALDAEALEELERTHKWLREWAPKRLLHLSQTDAFEFHKRLEALHEAIDRMSDFSLRRNQ